MNFTFDAKTHTYYLDGKRMTGVTTILGVLNKPALVPWAARMAVEYIEEYWDITFAPDEEAWKETLEEAKTAYAKKRDEGADVGTIMHGKIEEWIKSQIALHK